MTAQERTATRSYLERQLRLVRTTQRAKLRQIADARESANRLETSARNLEASIEALDTYEGDTVGA